MPVEKCYECNDGILTPSSVSITGSRNGEEYTVTVPGFVCATCGYTTIDNRQSGEFTRAVSDAYKQAHGLLTGSELRKRRSEWLNMSQHDFADYLGVGKASVKRWESGQIQDRAMDELIRLKTDPEAARINLHALEVQVPEEYVLSRAKLGYKHTNLGFTRGQNLAGQPQMTMSQFYVPVFHYDIQSIKPKVTASSNMVVVGHWSQTSNVAASIGSSLDAAADVSQGSQLAAATAMPPRVEAGSGSMAGPRLQ